MVTGDATWPDWLPSTDNSATDSHVRAGVEQDISDFSREIVGLCKAQPDGDCKDPDVRTPVLNIPALTTLTPSGSRSSQTPRRSSLFQTNTEFQEIPTPPQTLRSLAPQSGVLSPLSSSWAGLQEPKTLSYPEPRKNPPHSSSVFPAKPPINEKSWLERLKVLGNAIESYKRHCELRRDLQRSHNAIVSDGFITFSDHTKDSIIRSTNTLNLKACEENARLEGYLNELLTPSMWMHPSEPLPAREHIMAIRDTSETRKELAEVKAAVGYLASVLNLSGPSAGSTAADRMQSPEDGEIPPSFTSLPGLEVPEPKVKPADLEGIRARADRHSEQLTAIEGVLAERGPPPDLQTLWEAQGAECMHTSGLDATVQKLEEQVASYRAQLDAAMAERAALREGNTELKVMLDGLIQKQRHGQEALDKAQAMLKDLNEKLGILSSPCHCGVDTHLQSVHSLVQEVVRRTLTSMMTATMGELDQMIKESEAKTLTTTITKIVNLQRLTNDLLLELRTEPKIDFSDFKP